MWYRAGVCLLPACGGGGGADASVAPIATAPVEGHEEVGDEEGSQLAVPEGDALGNTDVDIEGEGAADPAEFAIEGYPQAPLDGDDKAAASQPGTLYVSPKGKDSNPGTAAAPFRSLARAAKAARAGTRVLVAPGSAARPAAMPAPASHSCRPASGAP